MTLNTLLVAAVGHALAPNPAPAPAPASNPAPNPVAEAPPVIKKQTLFQEKKSVSNVAAANAMSAATMFLDSVCDGDGDGDADGGGHGHNVELAGEQVITKQCGALSIDAGASMASDYSAPISSMESAMSTGHHKQKIQQQAPSNVAQPPQRRTMNEPRQMNVPIQQHFQQSQQCKQELEEQNAHEVHEEQQDSFISAVDHGLPHIRTSWDNSNVPQHQQHQQHQQQRASYESYGSSNNNGNVPESKRGAIKKPSPRNTQMPSQRVKPNKAPPQGQAPRGAGYQQRAGPRTLNVPIQQQFQHQQQQQQQHQQHQQHQQQQQGIRLSRDNNRSAVRLSAADIIEEGREERGRGRGTAKKELAKAQKKLKKQQQLQEWIREKENRALTAQAKEEEAKKAAEAEEAAKEKKRREYARKQKEKLQGYKSKIKVEAEKISELVELGIDPSSLF